MAGNRKGHVLTGHTLMGDGAAFDTDGRLLSPEGKQSGTGCAKCQCGWFSKPVGNETLRRSRHREHKRMVREMDPGIDDMLDMMGGQ